jgi:hypothetical protein
MAILVNFWGLGISPHFSACQVLLRLANSWRMARKPIAPSKRARSAGISLPPDMIRTARKLAFQKGLSLSAFVRAMLARELGEGA